MAVRFVLSIKTPQFYQLKPWQQQLLRSGNHREIIQMLSPCHWQDEDLKRILNKLFNRQRYQARRQEQVTTANSGKNIAMILKIFLKRTRYGNLQYHNHKYSNRDNEQQSGSYKKQLIEQQIKVSEKLLKFLKEKYQIQLNVFHYISFTQQQDESFMKIVDILQNMVKNLPINKSEFQSHWQIMSTYSIASMAKSTAISLALINQHISLEQAVNMARLDQKFQSTLYGRVEGAHDLDQAHTLSTFSTAKVLINLIRGV